MDKGERGPRVSVQLNGETYRKLRFIAGYEGIASSTVAARLLESAVLDCNEKTLQSIKSA